MFPAIQRVEDKYFSSVRHPEPFEMKADTERKRGGGSGVLRCSLQAPLCRDVPLFSHSYDATKFKRGILSIRCAIHCARNNPVAKTLRFTRRCFSWLPVDTEFIFHAPLSAVSMFHRLPLILEFSWPRLFRAYGHATCFMILFLDHEIPGNSPLLCLKRRVSKIQERGSGYLRRDYFPFLVTAVGPSYQLYTLFPLFLFKVFLMHNFALEERQLTANLRSTAALFENLQKRIQRCIFGQEYLFPFLLFFILHI